MDHPHTNYFLPFDPATYFDSATAAAAAATYNPYTDFYSHQQSAANSSSTAAAASYHQMYRTTPTTLRHPTSFYSATMHSELNDIFFSKFYEGNDCDRSSIVL
jgi:hypothetical protein